MKLIFISLLCFFHKPVTKEVAVISSKDAKVQIMDINFYPSSNVLDRHYFDIPYLPMSTPIRTRRISEVNPKNY